MYTVYNFLYCEFSIMGGFLLFNRIIHVQTIDHYVPEIGNWFYNKELKRSSYRYILVWWLLMKN